MKRVLCYGDSNTWGCSPRDGSRFDENTRWPMVMASILGSDYFIIEDGLNGRTVLNLSPVESDANGIAHINAVIESYIPLDIIIICLGTNDVFIGDDIPARIITEGVSEIIDIIRNIHIHEKLKIPEIIITAPPEYNMDVEGSDFYQLQINKLMSLPEFYSDLAEQKNCLFFDAGEHVKGSHIDGSHLEAESHIILGRKIAEFILSRIK
jgi:lysophospholipase L1-like esterase